MMKHETLHQRLNKGLKGLSIELDEAQQEKLLHYISLLQKWNKAYNLTAIRDPSDMVSHHLLDSLAITNYLEGERFIDVGTGGGLPGIPLAIANPEKFITLLDSNQKKTRFLVQAKHELKLNNVEIVASRAEHYHPESCYHGVLTRAFSELDTILKQTRHLLCANGQLLAMKGTYPEQELAKLAEEITIEVESLQVPYIEAPRHLVILKGVNS